MPYLCYPVSFGVEAAVFVYAAFSNLDTAAHIAFNSFMLFGCNCTTVITCFDNLVAYTACLVLSRHAVEELEVSAQLLRGSSKRSKTYIDM